MKAEVKKSTWQLQEAKNAFSEVVNRALTEGVQTITRHGKPIVKIIPISSNTEDVAQKRPSILDILRSCPEPLKIERINEPVRDIDL